MSFVLKKWLEQKGLWRKSHAIFTQYQYDVLVEAIEKLAKEKNIAI